MGDGAEKILTKQGVEVVKSTKIVSATVLSNGKTELSLSNNTTLTVDLYLPTVGLVPNSSYVPASLRNERGFVKVDNNLRVKDVKDVWAAGDIADIQRPQLVNAMAQIPVLVKNLDAVLKGKAVSPYKPGTAALAVTLGRSKATGVMGSFKLPGFMIHYMSKFYQLSLFYPRYLVHALFPTCILDG